MNLIYETNNENVEKKKYTGLLIAIIIVIILLIGIGGYLLYLIQSQENAKLKIAVDGNDLTGYSENFIYNDEKNKYISVKEFAQIMGYNVYNGGYKEYTEEQTKCYIESKNEIVNFVVNSDEITKIQKEKPTENYQYFTLDQKIIQVNGIIYISLDGAKNAFNVDINVNGNSIQIFSVEYLASFYKKQYENAIVEEFADMKTILYGAIIVKGDNGRLGINTLENKIILGTKYSKIIFNEEMQEFYVTTMENKIGIVDLEGNIKIEPNFEEIVRIDKKVDLYAVKSNGKYGIINEKNEIVLYIEFDIIGISNYSKYNEVKNPYLLYDSVIPVCKNGKWGLIDINRKVVLPLEYDEIGCQNISSTSDRTPVLLIEDYNAIVMKRGDYYGIFNYKGETLIPIALSEVYSTINSGEKTYSMVYLGETMDVLGYLKEQYLKENTTQEQVGTSNVEAEND